MGIEEGEGSHTGRSPFISRARLDSAHRTYPYPYSTTKFISVHRDFLMNIDKIISLRMKKEMIHVCVQSLLEANCQGCSAWPARAQGLYKYVYR